MTTDRIRMAELHRQQMTAPQIADELGCSVRTVTRWRSASGIGHPAIPNAGRQASPERLAEIEVMLNDGASFNDIVHTLHVSASTLRRYFPGRGWSTSQAGQIAAMARQLNRLQPRLP